jgi:hypothetical protein
MEKAGFGAGHIPIGTTEGGNGIGGHAGDGRPILAGAIARAALRGIPSVIFYL